MFREVLKTVVNRYLDADDANALVEEILSVSNTEITDIMYQAAFELGPVAYLIVNNELKVIKRNQLAEYLLDGDRHMNLRELVDEESTDLFEHYIQKVFSSSFSLPTHLYFQINGERKYIKMITKRIDRDHLQCAIVDESFEKNAMYELEVISFRDYLTGLYNRRFFHEELVRLDVKRNHPIGLIMADVNGLKLINDAFGHHVGDQLIKLTGQVLERTCRKDDIVARIGGDEFAIILPNTERHEIVNLINRIKAEIDAQATFEVKLSIACGYSIKGGMMDDFQHLFKRAEDDMYKDKLLNASSQRVEIINGILATLHEKHERESIHSEAVSQLMVHLGRAMGFDTTRLSIMASAGLLHDIGKIAIDYEMLEYDRALQPEEMAIVKKHSEIGYRILKSTTTFGDIADFILHHHENVDGSGYPKGICGSEIPLESRMLRICDAYDAMVSKRFYKRSLTKKEAIVELKDHAGHQFDRLLVDIFINKVL